MPRALPPLAQAGDEKLPRPGADGRVSGPGDNLISRGIEYGLHSRIAVCFAIGGDLRFISHHDSLRMFARALTRAGIPIRYSQGFNPKPRVRIALPRPVGVASHDERLLVELNEPMAPECVLDRLVPHLPDGVSLISAENLPRGHRLLPVAASYGCCLPDDLVETVSHRSRNFIASATWAVTRRRHEANARRAPAEQKIDIRRCIQHLEVRGSQIAWTQTLEAGGTARPGEILEAVGVSAANHLHRVIRTHVEYAP